MKLIVFFVLSIFITSAWSRESSVKLQFVVENNNSHHGFATNTGPVMQSVIVEMTGTNLATDRAWPQVFVIKPGERRDLGYVRSANPQAGYRFSTRLSSIAGSYLAPESTDPPFRLPYLDGEAHAIDQAYGNTLTSHADPLVQQAVDFNMPEGTSVVAARDGVVAEVEDSFTTGGTDALYLDKANQVMVQHADGTVAVYAHLFPRSARVTVGQHVRAGEVLAKSGNTGFSSGPHLHFASMRPKITADNRFVLEALPVHFATGNPVRILVPVKGLLATAASDGPANISYERIAVQRNVLREALPPQAEQPEAYPPMEGDKPVVRIEAVPRLSPLQEILKEYWLWIAGGTALLIVINSYFGSHQRRNHRD
ncbi:M23 family metallopeptidase [Uliginosibacterium sp. H3]|uniref:M23 family metallopeptidase n=1 Tax=Uliginosibacterium silvisoli TaxID=3114758 RepID=A0ABU6JZF4_9RHOO|nr:M23 family metallopeptidase [Uliginosibacterium sp. H3]